MSEPPPPSTAEHRWPELTLPIILLSALLIREAFSFWTGHPFDFEIWIRTGYVVAHGMDPYVGLQPPVPGVSFAYPQQALPLAAYPPFWPELLGGLYRAWESVGGGNRFFLYFLLKQPPILGDVATCFLLYRLVERWTSRRASARSVAAFWAFFPYGIMVSAVWGQFDSLVVVVLLMILWVRSAWARNSWTAAGVFLKWLTAVLVPLEFFRARGWGRLRPLAAIAGLLGAAWIFFQVTGWGLGGIVAIAASEAQGTGGGMNYAHWLSYGPIRGLLGDSPFLYGTIPYLWIPSVVVAGAVASSWVGDSNPEAELRAMLLVITILLLTRWGLNEQYLPYLFAPLALDVAAFHPQRRSLANFAFLVSTGYLLVHDDLGAVFLGPVRPGLVPFLTRLDSSGPLGDLRTWILFGGSVVVTIFLLQIAWTVYRNDEDAWPWLLHWVGIRRPGPPDGSA